MRWQLTILAIGISLAACAQDSVSTIRVKKGKRFKVELRSNPSTGYRWMWQKGASACCIDSVGYQFLSNNSSGMVGVPGTEVWSFKAKKRGTYSLEFFYRRPWEQEPPASTKKLDLEVY